MCHMSPCGRSAQRCTPCVGKKVEYPDPAGGIPVQGLSDNRRGPVPVDGLFREEPGVFETEGLQMKCQVLAAEAAVLDIPFLGQPGEFPLSAAFRTSVIVSVWLFPAAVFPCGIPDHLRIRAYQYIISPALKFFTGGGIEDFIVLPVVCDPHNVKVSFLKSINGSNIMPSIL